MKQLIMAAVLTLVAGMAHAADLVEGTWQTKKDDNGNFGHIQVKPCGPASLAFAATVAPGSALSKRKIRVALRRACCFRWQRTR